MSINIIRKIYSSRSFLLFQSPVLLDKAILLQFQEF